MADETATQTPAPAPVKQGWKTTEFWLNLATVVVGAILSLGPILHLAPDNKYMQIAGLAAMLLGATGHTVSRTFVKASMVFFCCLALAGCCSGGGAPLKKEIQVENDLMAELSAYIQADPKKSDDLKKDEALKIKAHLDNFNSLTK